MLHEDRKKEGAFAGVIKFKIDFKRKILEGRLVHAASDIFLDKILDQDQFIVGIK